MVDGVSDGEEAVACARRHGHSLILMDMKMPVMEGLQATRAIRPLPERSLVPTLAMTGNAFAEGRDRCLAAGMNGRTGKPLELNTLWATIQQWRLSQAARPASECPGPGRGARHHSPALIRCSGLASLIGLSKSDHGVPQQQRGQHPHGHTDQGVEHLPSPWPAKPGCQPAGPEAEQGEPAQAGAAGTRDEPAAQRGRLLRADAAHQQHSVEVDVGIEQRESRGLRQRGSASQTGTTHCRIQAARMSGAAQRLPPVQPQEDRTGEREGAGQPRTAPEHLRHPQHASGNQDGVHHRAKQHHAADVLAAQTLAQHEGVLRPDRHDESEAQGQALNEHVQGQ